MIIDIHGHVSAPTELWAYKANLLSARGAHGRGGVNVSDDEIRAAANRKENWAEGPSGLPARAWHRRPADFAAAVSVDAVRKSRPSSSIGSPRNATTSSTAR